MAKFSGISGWYYDYQMDPVKSRMTTVSLHTNMEFSMSQPKDPKESSERIWKETSKPKDEDGYESQPLCTSILAEDFNIGISNNWTDCGGDALGEMWNQVKQYAPYVGKVAEVVEKMHNAQQGQEYNGAAGWMAKIVDYLGTPDENNRSVLQKTTDYMNRVLVVQGTRFSYYSGTDINFGTLTMKFTVLPTWKDGRFITVNEQIDALYPYFVGEFVQGIAPEVDKVLPGAKEFIGWQKPPNGFEPNVHNVDTVQKGTFKLKLGAYYSIYNLVIADAQFNYSKQMVKKPIGDDTRMTVAMGNKLNADLKKQKLSPPVEKSEDMLADSIISPLYCDILLTFKPATKYSDESLKKFVSGITRSEEVKTLSDTLSANITEKQNELNQRYY